MANVPTTSWNESSPAGGDNISAGDNRIREMKTQIREVIDVDHDFPSSGQATDNGQHKKVTLQEQADLGSGAVGATILGNQTVSGKGELVYTDEDDNDIQITSGGHIDGASIRLDNNESLTATDNAGTGTVALIKANTSDQAEVTPALVSSGGVILPEISAPTTAANQGALYTKNDGDQTELYFREESSGDEVQITNGGSLNIPPYFSARVSKATDGTVYQATTDGIVSVLATRTTGDSYFIIYADNSNPPTTIRAKHGSSSSDGYFCASVPVLKNEYYKISVNSVASSSAYFTPLGS